MKTQYYTIQEVADRMGVSPSTLRAWERRYGFLMPARSAGGHRLYDEADLKLFLFCNHLKESGIPLGKQALRGRETLVRQALAHFECFSDPNDNSQFETNISEKVLNAFRARDFDRGLEIVQNTSKATTGALEFANLAVGIMARVGEAWQKGEVGISAEHLLTSQVKYLLSHHFYTLPSQPFLGPQRPTALCACFPEEHHEIGLLRVAIYLKSLGFSVYYLGANNPTSELINISRDLKPTVMCMSVTSSLACQRVQAAAERLNHALNPLTLPIVGGSGLVHLVGKIETPRLILTEDLGILQKLAGDILEAARLGKTQEAIQEILQQTSR